MKKNDLFLIALGLAVFWMWYKSNPLANINPNIPANI